MKVKPRLNVFQNEFLSFSKALNIMKSNSATKPFDSFEKYDLQQKL